MKTVDLRQRLNVIVLSIFLLLSVCLSGCVNIWAPLEQRAEWKFAVISDTQGDSRKDDNNSCINDRVVRAIAEDIVRENPDFVLVAGDLVNGWIKNGGTAYAVQYANWKEAMNPVYHSGIKVYPIRGNHDDGPERLALPPLPAHLEPPPGARAVLKQAFLDAFPEPYIPTNGPAGEERLTYSFTHKNAFVVGLDQYSGCQHKINQAWLDRQLPVKRKLHVFVFGHEPAFELKHKDNLSFFPQDRDLFWDSIGEVGARIYFCGHDHFYDRAMIKDRAGNEIRQIIAGTGGGRLRTFSGMYKDNQRIKGEYHNGEYHGYVVVTVAGQKATVVWKALMDQRMDAWQLLDTFTYSVSAK